MGTKSFLLLTCSTLLLCACGKKSSSNGGSGQTKQIDAATGGSIETTDSAGTYSAKFDPATFGASGTVAVAIAPITAAALPATTPDNSAFLSAAKFTADKPIVEGKTAAISLPIPKGGTPGASLALILFSDTKQYWEYSAPATVSADGKSATATVSHFSTYALAKLPMGTIEMSLNKDYRDYVNFENGFHYRHYLASPVRTVIVATDKEVSATNFSQDLELEPWVPDPVLQALGGILDLGVKATLAEATIITAPTTTSTNVKPTVGHVYAVATTIYTGAPLSFASTTQYAKIRITTCNVSTAVSTAPTGTCRFDWIFQPSGTLTF